MPRATLDDLTVHYQQVGSGPDLVLIHGLFANLAFWYLTVVPMLAGSFRVTVYDLRGHGLTQRLPTGYRAADLAEDLRRLLDYLGIKCAHLVGHSFGGAVALAFAISNPARTRSLTLADAWIPTLQPWPRPRRWAALQARLMSSGLQVGHDTPKVLQGFLAELMQLNDTEEAGTNPAARVAARLLPCGREPLTLRRWRQLVSATSAAAQFSDGTGIAADEISSFHKPAAIVFGKHSPYLPTMRALRRHLSDCEVTLVPNAGHYFPILNADLFASSLTQFVQQHHLVRFSDL